MIWEEGRGAGGGDSKPDIYEQYLGYGSKGLQWSPVLQSIMDYRNAIGHQDGWL